MPWPEVSIVSSRLEFVTLAMSDEVNIRVLCRRFGVCPSTAYKWIRRYERDGPAGLEDQSRRPHYSPKRTPKNIESQILAVRDQHPSWGGRKIQDILLKKGISSVPSARSCRIRKKQSLDPLRGESPKRLIANGLQGSLSPLERAVSPVNRPGRSFSLFGRPAGLWQ